MQSDSRAFVVARRSKLVQTIHDYLAGQSDERTVQFHLDGIFNDWEAGNYAASAVHDSEAAFWSVVWTAQHLCSESHSLTLASEHLKPPLSALLTGAPLPAGISARRP